MSTGRDIMFSSNNTTAEEFRLAERLGTIINLDDLTLVDLLEQSIGHIPETVCCRYNPGGTFTLGQAREGFQVMDNPGEAKYGMTRAQLVQAFSRLAAKGVKHFGLHSFLASNTLSNEYYPALARILFQLAVELKEETGVHISFIDLSGGIGVPYRPDQAENDIAAIGEGVRQAYEELLVPAGMGDVVHLYRAGPVHAGPLRPSGHPGHPRQAYLQGVYRRGRLRLRPDAPRHVRRLPPHHRDGQGGRPLRPQIRRGGSLCENNKFAVDRMLPQIDTGDLLVIHDTGAHGASMGYNYNGKLRSAELLLHQDGSVEK